MSHSPDNRILPQTGQPFSPYQMFQVSLVPLGMLSYTGTAGSPPKKLSDGAKHCYGLLNYHGGKSGEFPYQRTLAVEMAVSVHTIKRYIAELEAHGFIKAQQNGRGKPNAYQFIFHELLAGCLRKKVPDLPPYASPEQTEKGASSDAKRCQSWVKKVPEMAPPIKEEEVLRGIEEVSSSSAVVDVPKASDDDTTIFSKEEEKTKEPAAMDLGGTWEAAKGKTDPLMGADPLPEWFLAAAAEKIRQSKGGTKPPDIRFTEKIVEPWRGKGARALEDWVLSTADRGLGAKSKATGQYAYGIFLSDSQACAQNWLSDGKPMSKAFAMAEIAQNMAADRRATNERRQALMETPVPIAQAIKILNSEAPGWQASVVIGRDEFVPAIKRKSSTISPSELRAEAHRWSEMGQSSAAQSKDGGTSGRAL